jgi:septum formation protein
MAAGGNRAGTRAAADGSRIDAHSEYDLPRVTAPQPQLILASASPRRAALLTQMGLRFRIVVSAIDETSRPGEAAAALVERLAIAKARAVAALSDTDVPVLGADTTVVCDAMMLAKPADRADGLAMLARLSGRSHEVLTAVAIVQGARTGVRLSLSRVYFRQISLREADAYWSTGEPLDKAGGYGIQGIGGIFIRRIEGSFSGVAGLPLAETEALLQSFGVNTWQYRGA